MNKTYKFEAPNWDYIYELIIELSQKIKKSHFKPDIIIGVSRGGWPPARVLSDFLENSNIANVKVEFYHDIYNTAKEPIITQQVSSPIKGKKILIVDDVSDSGKTLKLLSKETVKEAKEVKTVTLYYKPWTEYKPDYYARETDAWIIFPWERYEMTKIIGKNMLAEGKTTNEITKKLIKIGLNPTIVKKFVKDIWKKKK